jgi:hypothetical protein
MSDRFTRDAGQSPQPRDHRDLARRLREQMRTAVSNVRAGASAATHAVNEAPDADRPDEREPRREI